MTEREKVFDAFRNCITEPKCRDCPWESCEAFVNQKVEIPKDLALAVIRMLAAQEPRVMTLEELATAQKTPVWRETKRAHKDLYNGWMLAYDIQRGQGITGTRQGMTEPNGRIGWYKLDDYGKTWRCWTSCPTDEQREAAPWEA